MATPDPRMPDMTVMKGSELAAIIRGRVLRDMFPVPDKPEFTYIHPKWRQIWAELRGRSGPIRCAFIIVITILLWPFQLVWWLTRALLAKPVVKAMLATAILGGVALWFWSWPGLLVACLFVWLFTMFRQHQKSSSTNRTDENIEMAVTVKKQIKVLVIGTDHNIQRHQDTDPKREKGRAEFERVLRAIIEKEEIALVAEEAGDDTEVWESLKHEEEALGKFAEAFGGGKTVNAPVGTIAKQIADERLGELRHIDIRAPNAENLSVEERDAAMTARVKEILGDADSVVVIVGEDHRKGVAQRLKEDGMNVDSLHFP